ncbi:MAG: 7,8-didemethyl-8-hydroxy-5-deazariboflavin synthase CofG, partial [Nitrososphaerales archaeon]
MSIISSKESIFNLLEDKNLDSEFREVLYKSLEGKEIKKEEAYRIIKTDNIETLFFVASIIRDNFKGKRITYSRKIFIPLTNICRNKCGYCGFRREPKDKDAKIMKPDEVLSFAKSGSKANCTEALFTLGEKPELKYPEVKQELKILGYSSTLEYLRDMCELVIKNTGLLPHSNPGIMTKKELADLKDVNASMGLMLENVSDRLCDKNGPHEFSPGKRPKLRLATIEYAGQLKIPFTTGLLIGIGESYNEIIDSLYAIKEINEKYGHIQEIIIQNFRAKPNTPMQSHREPSLEEITKIIALARIIFLGKMNIQA